MATFEEKIKSLIESTKASDFSFETMNDIADVNKEQFWNNLLDFLKNENNSSKLGHYLVRNNDDKVDGSNTVFGLIDSLADLDDNTLTYLINSLSSSLDITETSDSGFTGSNYFWNESVSKAIAHFLLHLNPSTITTNESSITENENSVEIPYGSIKTSGQDFRVTDIKQGDAGRSFKAYSSTQKRRWVRPWYNIDGDTYSKVRGSDKIEEVLNDSSNLQFTRVGGTSTTDDKWIRLIMPEYNRAVEIEDLDRNFWVIGQILAAISAYLFDDDSPITTAFKNLLNEVVQLWENVMYLWAIAALAATKNYYTNVHCEVVYLPNAQTMPYRKFDNFDAATPNDMTLEQAWNQRLKYLIDLYPESHLCIVPVNRYGNYQHNYYYGEKYLGIVLYNRNTNTTELIHFDNFNNGFDLNINNERPLYSNSSNEMKDYLIAMTELDELDNNKKIKVKYYAPANANVYEDIGETYYAAIRVIPNLTASFDSSTNTISVSSFKLTGYDALRGEISNPNGSTRCIFEYQMNTSTKTLATTDTETHAPTETDVTESAISSGAYMGELISCITKSQTMEYDIEYKVVQAMPFQYSKIKTTLTPESTVFSHDSALLNAYIKQNGISNKICLWTCLHQTNLFKSYYDDKLSETIINYFIPPKMYRFTSSGAPYYAEVTDLNFYAYNNQGNLKADSNMSEFPNSEDSYYSELSSKQITMDMTTDQMINAGNTLATNTPRYNRARENFNLEAKITFGKNQIFSFPSYSFLGLPLPSYEDNSSLATYAQSGELICGLASYLAPGRGRMHKTYRTAMFYHDSGNEALTSSNWLIKYIEVEVNFGPRMSNSYFHTYDVLDECIYDSASSASSPSDFDIPFYTENSNHQGVHVPSDLGTPTSRYVDKWVYGYPIAAADFKQFINNTPTGTTRYYEIQGGAAGTAYTGTGKYLKMVKTSTLAQALANNDTSILNNSTYDGKEGTGICGYFGISTKVQVNYFSASGILARDVHYRLSDNYNYSASWIDTTNSNGASTFNDGNNGNGIIPGYTLFRVSGDWTETNSDGKTQLLRDFSKTNNYTNGYLSSPIVAET